MKKLISAQDKDNVLNFFVDLGPAWQSRFFSPEIQIPGYAYEDVVQMLQQFEKLGLIDKAAHTLGGFVDFRITLGAHDFIRRGGFRVQELALQKNLDELLDDLVKYKTSEYKTDSMTWDLVIKVEKVSMLLSKVMPLIDQES